MSSFLQLQTEFFARGFDYLNDGGAGLARAKAWLNRGYQWIAEQAEWPSLYAEATGTPSLSIPTCRENGVRYVFDVTNAAYLEPAPTESIHRVDPTLVHTGNPQYWYLDESSGAGAIIGVWPGTTSSIGVDYLKIPTALTANGDIPISIPTSAHLLIADFAVKLGLEDNDNFQEAAALQTRIDADIAAMRVVYVPNQRERARTRGMPPQAQPAQPAARR